MDGIDLVRISDLRPYILGSRRFGLAGNRRVRLGVSPTAPLPLTHHLPTKYSLEASMP